MDHQNHKGQWEIEGVLKKDSGKRLLYHGRYTGQDPNVMKALAHLCDVVENEARGTRAYSKLIIRVTTDDQMESIIIDMNEPNQLVS